jgi:UDP-N-acetylglucosamine 2-epimerase (non-hydrolysing)
MHKPWPTDLGPVICVVGARPNFMKMAPILRAFAAHQPAIPYIAAAYRPAL